MQIDILFLFLGLLLYEQTDVTHTRMFSSDVATLAAALLPYLLPVIAIYLQCQRVRRMMNDQPGRASNALVRTQNWLNIWRWSAAAIFLISIYALDYLSLLQQWLGFTFIVPDLIALLPPLGVSVFGWWAYYPIHRRLQESALIRQLDEGLPVYPPQSRGSFVRSRIRHQMMLILLPMLLILVWVQLVALVGADWQLVDDYQPGITAAGAIVVFLAAPLLLRLIWDVIPMPAGELRQRLLDLCKTHRVKVRQLLLWRTYSGMINGAVMGVVAPLRVILLTDGLVAQLPDSQIEAVMAHELGHVRRHHMPMLAVTALGTMGAMMAAVDMAMWAVERFTAQTGWRDAAQTAGLQSATHLQAMVGAAITAGVVIAWVPLFGWISRRFERQADTFAVQHFSDQVISEQAVRTMADALRNICVFNNASTTRPSWRHGSIEWRINYLHTLIGRRVDDCPIDRRVRKINIVCFILLIASLWSDVSF